MEKRKAYKLLIGRPEEKGPWEDQDTSGWKNTEKDLGKIGCGGVDWIALAQDRDKWRVLVNSEMNLQGP
jgi:hypothetical protein